MTDHPEQWTGSLFSSLFYTLYDFYAGFRFFDGVEGVEENELFDFTYNNLDRRMDEMFGLLRNHEMHSWLLCSFETRRSYQRAGSLFKQKKTRSR